MSEETVEKRTIAARSIQAQQIINLLIDIPELGIVTDEQVAKEIGEPAGHKTRGYGYVQTALKALLREHDMVFNRIRKVGWQRADIKGKLDRTGSQIPRLRRMAVRNARILETVTIAELSQPQLAEFNKIATIHAVVHHFTQPRRVKAIGQAVQKTHARLPIDETLAAFKDGKKR